MVRIFNFCIVFYLSRRIKGLGAAEDDDPVIDSAAAWVAKSRMQAKEKEMAAKRVSICCCFFNSFGISNKVFCTNYSKIMTKFTSLLSVVKILQ